MIVKASNLDIWPETIPAFSFGKSMLYHMDCVQWLLRQPDNTIHGVVTDPPYALIEYSVKEQEKLRSGRGGVWRIPPSFDGNTRAPLPRFTTLKQQDLENISHFFEHLSRVLTPVLVPGAHVMLASNPLVQHVVATALTRGGLEPRGTVIRCVQTMRGGDRPKNAHDEFTDVTVMPRSQWEPWILMRKPVEGRVQDNLRKWRTGGLRRISPEQPFGDVIDSHPTQKRERTIAPHPSLKPQSFLRKLVRAVLPLGEGIIYDPFAGSGSAMAAAEALGYRSVGTEIDDFYVNVARTAIPSLSRLTV